MHTWLYASVLLSLLMTPRASTNASFEPKEFSLNKPKYLSGICSQGSCSVCSVSLQAQAEGFCPQWFGGA